MDKVMDIETCVKHLNSDGTINHYKVNGSLMIPPDPDNRHYAEIMRQVDEGTLTIQDAE